MPLITTVLTSAPQGSPEEQYLAAYLVAEHTPSKCLPHDRYPGHRAWTVVGTAEVGAQEAVTPNLLPHNYKISEKKSLILKLL